MNRIPGLRLEELAEALSKLNVGTQQAILGFMRFGDSLFVQSSTYVGPLKHLRGETAFIRQATHGKVVAQFDNVRLTRNGEAIPEVCDEPPDDALGY